jgi:hypothetical protein
MRSISLVAPAFAPEFGRLQGWHEKLDGPCPVLFLADDLLDLAQDTVAQRQPGVDAGRGLPDEACAQHEAVRDDLGLCRRFAQQGHEEAGYAHVGLRENLVRGQNFASVIACRGSARKSANFWQCSLPGMDPLPGPSAILQACGMTAPNIAEIAENKK